MDTKQTGKEALDHNQNLIDCWDCLLTPYPNSGDDPYGFSDYVNSSAFDWRDEIHTLGLDNDPRVIRLDRDAIRKALKGHPYFDSMFRDEKPLEYWWWYLDRIHDHTYPNEMLPPHLQEIYTPSK